jgi:hypothetical protein
VAESEQQMLQLLLLPPPSHLLPAAQQLLQLCFFLQPCTCLESGWLQLPGHALHAQGLLLLHCQQCSAPHPLAAAAGEWVSTAGAPALTQ